MDSGAVADLSADLSVETAGKLLGHLIEEGLVVHALDAKAPKLGTAKQPYHVPTEDARSFDKLQYELFDALSHISAYVSAKGRFTCDLSC